MNNTKKKKKLKSKLIDDLYDEIQNGCNEQNFCDLWYIAKPCFNLSLKTKLSLCLEILQNRAIAVHYREDEE